MLTLILLAVYIVVVSVIGIKNKFQDSNEGYFLASRQLPSWMLAITFIASWWGGGSAIDLADHAYNNGLSSFWIYGVPVLLATALMFIFAKSIRKLATLSQPQLMEKRYNSQSALLLSLFILIFMVIAAAIQVIVLGNFFESYFGISYKLGALIGVLAVIVYSLFGGFKGVVLTDFLQFIFFLVTGVSLLGISYVKSGGLEAVAQAAQLKGNSGYLNFFHDVKANLAFVITFGSSWMIQANVWQRISAAKTPAAARKMMGISFIAFIPLYLMVCLTGMFASTFYSDIPIGGIVPDMVKNISSPLISAVLFLGLCSAIMSTLDSLINTASLTLAVDIWDKYFSKGFSSLKQIKLARIFTLVTALAALYIGTEVRSVLTVSWIGSDFLATGVFVPLVLGFFWKKGTAKAAVSSMIFGLIFSSYNLAVALGARLPIGWEISSVEQALIGMGSSLVIFVSISLFTKDHNNKADLFIKAADLI